MITYILIGFNNYIIKDKILYRDAYRIRDKLCKFKHISEREIKRSYKDGVEGYYLTKKGKRKFYSLKKLKHKLKLQ
jgi:GR25 family glycosyltransferase involved in LPS biosynthesis